MTVDGKAKPVPQEDPSGVGSVDEILATGRYTDRRGRLWEKRIRWSTSSGCRMWSHLYRLEPLLGGRVYRIIDENQMRLLIARDKHRVKCKGLLGCRTHPVPVVTIQYNEDGLIIYETDYTRRTYPTLPAAMDAARALAVGE